MRWPFGPPHLNLNLPNPPTPPPKKKCKMTPPRNERLHVEKCLFGSLEFSSENPEKKIYIYIYI